MRFLVNSNQESPPKNLRRKRFIFVWWFLIFDQNIYPNFAFLSTSISSSTFSKIPLENISILIFWHNGYRQNPVIFFFWYTFQRQCVLRIVFFYFPFPQMRLRNKWTLNTSSVTFFRQAQWNGWPISIGPLFARLWNIKKLIRSLKYMSPDSKKGFRTSLVQNQKYCRYF